MSDHRGLICDGALVLHGIVGADALEGDLGGFTAADVLFALSTLGATADVTVRINSGGGVASEGLAIHAILSAHKGKVTTVVEGVAASAASVIAMAGAERVIAPGSLLMIHDPACLTVGTVDDHEDTITYLRAMSGAMASIYAAATKRAVSVVQAEMKAETWFEADDAVAKRYATRIGTAPVAATASAAFPFTAYARTPGRLAAVARAKGWDRTPFTAADALGRRARAGQPTPPVTREAAVRPRPPTLLPPAATAAQIAECVALARRAGHVVSESTTAAFLAEGRTVEQVKASLAEAILAKVPAKAASGRYGVPLTREAAVANMRRLIEREGLTPAAGR